MGLMAPRKRNDPVRLLGRRILLLVLFVGVIFGSIGVWNAYRKERESATLRDEAQRQLSDLSKRQDQLHTDIANLQTDRGKEAILRQQYALASKGEDVIVIVDQAQAEPQATSSAFADWFHHTFPWW